MRKVCVLYLVHLAAAFGPEWLPAHFQHQGGVEYRNSSITSAAVPVTTVMDDLSWLQDDPWKPCGTSPGQPCCNPGPPPQMCPGPSGSFPCEACGEGVSACECPPKPPPPPPPPPTPPPTPPPPPPWAPCSTGPCCDPTKDPPDYCKDLAHPGLLIRCYQCGGEKSCQCPAAPTPAPTPPPTPPPPTPAPTPPPTPSPAGKPFEETMTRQIMGFAAHDIDAAIAEYTKDSSIVIFNQNDNSAVQCKGTDQIRECTKRLVDTMSSESKEWYTFVEQMGDHPAHANSVFSLPNAGYKEGTASYIADAEANIWRQFTVVNFVGAGNASGTNLTAAVEGGVDPFAPAGTPGPFEQTMNARSAAFKAKNLEDVAALYTEDSMVTLHNTADLSTLPCKGLTEIKACYKRLFDSISSDQAYNHVHVEEKSTGGPATALVAFSIPGSGYKHGAGSFTADEANAKIYRQYTVVNYEGSTNITAPLAPSPVPPGPPGPAPAPAPGPGGPSQTVLIGGIVVIVLLLVGFLVAYQCYRKKEADRVYQQNLLLLEAARQQQMVETGQGSMRSNDIAQFQVSGRK